MKEGKLPKGGFVTFACLGFCVGIGVFSFVQTPSLAWCMVAAIVCVLITICLRKTAPLWLQASAVIVLGILFAAARYALSYPLINETHVSYYNGQTLSFRGIIFKEPVEKESGRQLTVRVEEGNDRFLRGSVLMTVPFFPLYNYGDRVEVRCRLEKPESKEFPYDRYLARYGIYSICNRPRVKKEGSGYGNPFLAQLIHIKTASYRIARLYMPEPTASLALPVVFGGSEGVAEEITEQFRRTGLTHIMAVSGFNVSLLTVLVGLILMHLGLSRRAVFLLSGLIVSAYVVMVAAPASAVRAGVMSLFLLLALTVGRLAKLPRSVLLVATLTLIVNPRLLRDDIGWQLSFLALLGLMYILPLLEKWSLALTKGRAKVFITALMATVSAQIATAPVILYNFGNFSVIAPLANLLVVWLIPVLTIAMMLALPLAALFPLLGVYFFFPSWLMVKYIFFIVQVLSAPSWAAFSID